MAQRTNADDDNDQTIYAEYDKYTGLGRLPHIIYEEKPNKPGTTNAWITSDTMYDLDRCL